MLVDARRGFDAQAKEIVSKLAATHARAILVLNKADLVNREKLLPLAEEINNAHSFSDTFMVSALTGSGVSKLRTKILSLMPEGPWHYPGDQAADVNLRFLAAEVTREKIYERLHDELPYASTVETEGWEEKRDGSVKISQTIFVERPGQKAIVLGKSGSTIKQLGQLARAAMEKSFERKVHLFLFVKVRENWSQDPERLRAMGLGD
jgi:GTP-binding protein Era